MGLTVSCGAVSTWQCRILWHVLTPCHEVCFAIVLSLHAGVCLNNGHVVATWITSCHVFSLPCGSDFTRLCLIIQPRLPSPAKHVLYQQVGRTRDWFSVWLWIAPFWISVSGTQSPCYFRSWCNRETDPSCRTLDSILFWYSEVFLISSILFYRDISTNTYLIFLFRILIISTLFMNSFKNGLELRFQDTTWL